MRLARSLVIALVGLTLLAACGTNSQRALAPSEDALAATATAVLAFEQYRADTTIPTVTVTTLDDMLNAVADAESEITALPSRTDAVGAALASVRLAADAISSALYLVQTGTGDEEDAAAALDTAHDALDATVNDLKAQQ